MLNFIKPILEHLIKQNDEINIIDLGSGKSYLGFIIYESFKDTFSGLKIHSVEWREDLVRTCRDLAKRLNFKDMYFYQSSIANSDSLITNLDSIDLCLALHACDTATDDTISLCLQNKIKNILLVPCCQAELASVLRKNKNLQLSQNDFSELWRHPIHTREFGSLTTNTLRSLRLQASGYNVTVTELTGWEHSLKNELFIAKYTGEYNSLSKARIGSILNQIGAQELSERFTVYK